ncbi:MAG TPA: PAS domain S-box protein [Rubellimicrobium sp.]|nr:PAS domain S-box protein [Rubellimicrobium sp.]
MTEGVSLSREDGTIVYTNPAEDRLFGYKPGELLGQHVSVQNAYPPEENERVVAAVIEDLKTSGAWQGEWRNRRKDGSVFTTRSRISTLEIEGKRFWLCVQENVTEERETARALQAERARLKLATEAAEIGIWDWELGTGVMTYSDLARSISGLPAEGEITIEDVRRTVHPDDYPHTWAQARRALDPAVRDRTPYEYRIVLPDHSVRWVLARGEAVFEASPEGPRAVRYLGTLQDITARHDLEEAEKSGAQRLRLALEAGQMAVWDLDVATNTVSGSPQLYRLLGFPEGQPIDAEAANVRYAPGERERVSAEGQAAFARGETSNDAEFRYIHPDHGIRWLRLRYDILVDPDGTPQRVIGVMSDETERKQAEAQVRASEAELRSLADALPLLVSFVGQDERYRFMNKAHEDWFGVPREELLGRTIREVLGEEAYAPRQLQIQAVLRGEPVRFEALTPGAAGARRDTEVHYLPRRNVAGEVDGLYGVVVDLTEQKAVQRATEEAREQAEREATRTGAILSQLAEGVIVTDRDGRITFVNEAAERIHGVARLDIAPAQHSEAYHLFREDGRPYPFDELPLTRASLRGEVVEEARWRIRRPDGREVVAVGGARPIRTADGVQVGAVLTLRDDTARAEAEALLRQLNEDLETEVAQRTAERKLLADVFESTDAMMSVASPDLRLLAFNRPYADEVERLGGRRPQVGDHIPDLYAGQPELAAPVEANWRRAVAGEVFSVTEEHGDPGRYRRSYERRFEPLYDREGQLVGAYQYATDVTERVRDQRRAAEAEAARRDADALYRAYFQNSGEALFVVGVLPDGGFTFEEVNPTHRAALGFDIAAEPGRRIEEVFPPQVARAVGGNYRRVVETGELQRYRETAELGGRVIHAETVLVPVRDEAGRIARIVGSGRDMTAQVQAEEALRQSQKMEAMGQLTGGVAHDFNNLLTPILGSLDRLQRRGLGDERDQRLIEGALQSAERAKTLVQRLLAFARRQPLQPTAINVAELVQGMADLVASTTGPQIKVAVEVEPGLPAALADANQLEMAILNLAVNARDAMPDGGILRISATSELVGLEQASVAVVPGRYLRLSVADTGVGMDEATLARAVEPFFSTKGIGRGTGLGLSMVHGLAAQLGGALTIRSRPGLGTNVELWLPTATTMAATDANAPKTADAEDLARTNGTVLLVDDEDLVRAMAADMLTDLGYAVIEASSADEALDLISQGLAPDLLVTDHLMPGLTGTELARMVQARHPGFPVLIVSGYADTDGIAPDLPRLTKPFRRADLAASLIGLGGWETS